MINLDEYTNTRNHRITLYILKKCVTYFDSSEVAHVGNEIITFIADQNIETNKSRIQAYSLIMCT